MKHLIILLSIALLIVGCNSAKRNQKLLDRGDYEQAIELAVKKLQRNKTNTKNDSRIVILEEAFAKAVAEDNRRIVFLKKQSDPSASKEIYYTYQNMEYIQGKIRPLLPLYSSSLGRNATFKIVDYSSSIVQAKGNFVDYLYDEAKQYMNRQTIADARTAYHVLCELDELQPNYKDVARLKNDSHFSGTDFVMVSLKNRSGQLIPIRLERELLDFNTYGLDDFWTQYHKERDTDVDYNYGIQLDFREIRLAPERVSEKEERRTKRIRDGWEYQLDGQGNVAKDSLGNDIKVDKYITVSARITFTEQSKAVFVGGDVRYKDLVVNREIDKFPISTEFVFENVFAKFRGDERALNSNDKKLLQSHFLPFPSNEQMVYDAGEDIKIRLKEILKDNALR
jgi:hypothetical protein